MNSLADREGLIIVYPNGTVLEDRGLKPEGKPGRCWNAGGGKNGYTGLFGTAFEKGVDDVQYFRDLLDFLATQVHVDLERVYATGISNGGAMAHRLGVELSDRIAAIAAVSGGNQFSTSSDERPGRPVPVLQIHGRSPMEWWPFDGGENRFGHIDASIPETMQKWVDFNGEALKPQSRWLPDSDPLDGTRIRETRLDGGDLEGEIRLMEIFGGGHTWPMGNQCLPRSMIGNTSQDASANEAIWGFFQKHSLHRSE